MRTVALFSSIFAGCAGSGGDSSPGDKSGDTGTGPVTESGGSGADTDTTVPTYTGVLDGTLTAAGAPVADTPLRLCRGTLCRNTNSAADGTYEYDAVPPVWHSFEAVPGPESGFATPFVPLLFTEGQHRTVDLHLLPYDDVSPLGVDPQELPAGRGLYITAGLGDLEPPLFEADATEISGVRVDDPGDQVPLDGISGTLLAMWYVDPFDHTAVLPGGLPIRIDDEWGLADGATLEVYVGNYEQSAWLDAGTVTAYGGSLTGASLPNIATVILVQP
jgi:hypothetical protein